jgi:DNA-binding response OmpR family regulator
LQIALAVTATTDELAVHRQQVILIVEDDAALRGMWRTALRLEGFGIVEAADGMEALKLIEASPPDLVILDIGLPHLDGIAVRKDLAAQVFSRHIPIVVITGSTDDLSYLDVNCILKKPVTTDHVILAIHRCIQSATPSIGVS